ncbi:RICIN domain-containing protein [Streptomyces sp. NPDC020800]|uniref:RICIN domain-containing protein n=1 Tax=Streptomyces sp. NPDC020800 TaxID=3365092 RepID=UPI003793939F
MGNSQRVKFTLGAMAMICAFLLACATTSSAAPAAFWALENSHSHLCLGVSGSSTAISAPVIQWSCDSGSEQQWNFVAGSGLDQYTLHNGNSGQCLAIGSSSTTVGAKAIQYPCNGLRDQLWKYNQINQLINVNSGLCLAIPGSSTSNGTRAVQWTCQNANADQQWGSI